MSCDLAVWHYDRRLSEKEALQRYTTLSEDPASLAGKSEAVDAFYAELTAKYPEINAAPEPPEGISPWSCPIDKTGSALVMAFVWPRANEVSDFVIALAKKHGLVVNDPQSERTIYPDAADVRKPAGFLSRLFGKSK